MDEEYMLKVEVKLFRDLVGRMNYLAQDSPDFRVPVRGDLQGDGSAEEKGVTQFEEGGPILARPRGGGLAVSLAG